ncbi:MAG TPA: aldo/keto reductase [Clostridiales bacterium]|nr:aldo/keto reductase [Clostridiales bacterium]
MKTATLGRTGIQVSRLCFGTLVLGPLQENLPVEKGADLLLEAMEAGIDFFDTAEIYGTYPYMRRALKRNAGRKNITIAAKSYAHDAKGAAKSLEHARQGMDVDVVDLFLLHEQESEYTLAGHQAALDHYLECRQKGMIRAVGLSTHCIAGVLACAERPELEVVHPLINRTGLGIQDGTIDRMLKAVKKVHDQGKGVYSMKALGGGNLMGSYAQSLGFVLDLDCVDAVAIGMKNSAEIEANRSFLKNRSISEITMQRIRSIPRKLHIDPWCTGCGNCVELCRQKALFIQKSRDGSPKAEVFSERCILCGYCSRACANFAIKIF